MEPGQFLACLYECTGRAIALPPASAFALVASASVWTKCLSFTLKFFKVMGKVLSGELSYTQTGLVVIKGYGNTILFLKTLLVYSYVHVVYVHINIMGWGHTVFVEHSHYGLYSA